MLFLLLRPLSRRGLAVGRSALRVAVGGRLPGALPGVAQVVVMHSVVTLAVDIRPSHPVGAPAFLDLAGYPLAGLALSTPAAYKQRVWTPSRLKPELAL